MDREKGRKAVWFFLWVVGIASPVMAQVNYLSEPLDAPVYLLLEIAETKGLLARLSQVKPYSRSTIQKLLREIDSKREGFSSSEIAILEKSLALYINDVASHENRLSEKEKDVLDDFLASSSAKMNPPWWQRGYKAFNQKESDRFPFVIGVSHDTQARIDAHAIGKSPHLESRFHFYMEGGLFTFLSYRMGSTVGLTRLSPSLFAPYSYTRGKDDITIDTDINDPPPAKEGGMSASEDPHPDTEGFGFGLYLDPEIRIAFADEKVRLGWARHRRILGLGEGNLFLSGRARPFGGFELSFRPARWLAVNYLLGDLEDERDKEPSPKMLTAQVVELFPLDWFYFSFSSGVVWAERFEFTYMNPLVNPILGQLLVGDKDNAALGFTGTIKWAPYAKIYVSFFIDEIRLYTDKIHTLFTDPSQQFALQGGIQAVIPGIPLTLGTFQYTKIEPYTYTHYMQKYLGYTDVVNINWTGGGENLGYPLPPNSDEFLLRFESLPAPRVTAFLEYQHIRHGHGTWREDTTGEMEGSVNAGGPTREEAHAYETEARKHFLHDAPYERIHTVKVGASYAFETYPVTLAVDYGLSFTQNARNKHGRPREGVVRIQNIVGLQVTIYQ